MIKTILVPLDRSEIADQALPVACAVASQTGAEVLLVTAIVPGDFWPGDAEFSTWQEAHEKVVSHYLETTAASLRRRGIAARFRIAWGPAAATINQIAEEEAADLIAMTTHGRSGLVRWVMGSVADKLLRTSVKPILLVHAKEETAGAQPVAMKRILVPLDGSPLAEAVLPFVGDLAQRLGATLQLERVVLPAGYSSGRLDASEFIYIDEFANDASDYLARVAAREESRGITVETDVARGHAALSILDAASRCGADLIALSTHGRSGPERWITGSVADAVIRHAALPCLVIPVRAAKHVEAAPPAESGDRDSQKSPRRAA